MLFTAACGERRSQNARDKEAGKKKKGDDGGTIGGEVIIHAGEGGITRLNS